MDLFISLNISKNELFPVGRVASFSFFNWDIEVQISLSDYFYNKKKFNLTCFFAIIMNIILKDLLIYISFIDINYLSIFLIYINNYIL